MHIIIAAVAGYIAGAFTPSIGRKIKALWVKDTQKVVVSVKTGAAAVESATQAEATKLASKI